MTRTDELNTIATRAIDGVRAITRQAAEEIKRLEGEVAQLRQQALTDGAPMLRQRLEVAERRVLTGEARVKELERALDDATNTISYTAADIQEATRDGARAMRQHAIRVVREHLHGWVWLCMDLDALADKIAAEMQAVTTTVATTAVCPAVTL